MQAPSTGVLDRANIQPQLDAFFEPGRYLSAGRLSRVQGLTEQLRRNGNRVFLNGVPEGPLLALPILLDGETIDQLIEEIPLLEGPRSTIQAAGNVSVAESNPALHRLNVAGLRHLGGLCAKVDLPFSYYDTTYPEFMPIAAVRADKHAAGMLEYGQRMRELGRAPIDRLHVGCDADARRIDPGLLQEMQASFDATADPVWMNSPNVVHDRLGDQFPRINHLLDWYDAHAKQFVRRTPACYGVNMAAYAASGGFDPFLSFCELSGLVDALIRTFGEEQITDSVLNSTVTVSARHLVHRMVLGDRDFEYEPLRVPVANTTDTYRNTVPAEDISRDRMLALLGTRIQDMSNHLKSLPTKVMDSPEGADSAVSNKILALDNEIGDLEGSSQLVQDIFERQLS